MTRRFAGRPLRNLALALTASVPLVLVVHPSGAGATAPPASARWTVEVTPQPGGSTSSGLASVSCPAPGSCVAVGVAEYPSGGQLPRQVALIERLVRDRWTVVTTGVRGPGQSTLGSVSCASSTFCVAVGGVPDVGNGVPSLLVDTWSGATWTPTTLPDPSGAESPELTTVSCPATGSCVAVGDELDTATDSYRPLVEVLAGGAWSVLPAPVPFGASADSAFTGADCTSVGVCEVVGIVAYDDTLQRVVAYGLDGTTWTGQHPVNPGPDPGNTDAVVSCASATDCASVGSVAVVGEVALAESWDGTTWERHPTPAPDGRPATELDDVSCPTTSSCLAVGAAAPIDPHDGHIGTFAAMALSWDGSRWTLSPPTGVSGATPRLASVACPSPGRCVAVGDSSTTTHQQPLAEAYAG